MFAGGDFGGKLESGGAITACHSLKIQDHRREIQNPDSWGKRIDDG
jgi:hypothetical protein